MGIAPTQFTPIVALLLDRVEDDSQSKRVFPGCFLHSSNDLARGAESA
jgi:hypothetical protein